MTTKTIFTAIYAVLLVLLMTAAPKAQLIEESFDYPDGDSIGAHGWVHFSPSSGTLNRLMVTSPGLEYIGYQSQGIGNSAMLTNSGQDSYKPLTSVQTVGSVYTFFLVRIDTARNNGDYFCSYLTSTSTTNFQGRVYAKKSSSNGENIAFGLSKTTTTGGVEWTDTVYSPGETYLVVLKYTFNEGSNTDDEVSLFVFTSGVPAFEPAPTIGPLTGTGTDAADIGRFALRQGSASSAANLTIDEIFTGTSWGGVLPVEMSLFNAYVNGSDVSLYWRSEKEINNAGFEIQRAVSEGQWSKIGYVKGNGNSSEGNDYSYIDRNLSTGTYYYRIKQSDINGNFEYFNLRNAVSIGIPQKYELSQNYPNPFNPTTNLGFGISELGFVSLKIYNASGKEVATIVNEVLAPGMYNYQFSTVNYQLSSGIYFYTLESGNFVETKRMILLK